MYHFYLTLIIPSLIAFFVTVIATKSVISYMMDSGVTATDHNKKSRRTLPSSGGLAVAFGFAIGVFVYVFGGNFPSPLHPFYVPAASMQYLLATVLSVLLISLVGFIDDINVKKKMIRATDMMDTKKGLKQWHKPVLTLIGAIPLMVVNAGVSVVSIPFIGMVNFGVFYPLIILPLAVIFAANSFNLLGGFDGIATGTGLIASLALLVYGIFFGAYAGTLIAAVLFATLLAFFIFNVYPARVMPGDSFTYGVGAALVSAMVLGNMESFGIIIFMPWIVEFLLHLKRKFIVTDVGKRRSDGTFESPYGKKIYSWTHLIMNAKRCREWEVSLYMWLIEIGFVLLAFGLKALALL